MWSVDIITFTPEAYPNFLGASILGRGLKNHLWELKILDIYDFSVHKGGDCENMASNRRDGIIDDRPYGGGAGMVMRPDVAARAYDFTINRLPDKKGRFIYPTPAGKPFTQEMARNWANDDGLIFLCGRFEGVDERFFEGREVEQISLGDFILCGGDIAAVAITEATLRYVTGILGDCNSVISESFTDDLLEYPHYTRPSIWDGMSVPDVLTSGNHAAIDAWRLSQSHIRTKERRIDLWKQYCYKNKDDK